LITTGQEMNQALETYLSVLVPLEGEGIVLHTVTFLAVLLLVFLWFEMQAGNLKEDGQIVV